MAVYTPLSPAELALWASRFRLGKVRSARGVAAGTINTLYDLVTDRGRYFLRLLEDRPARDAAFEAALLEWLAARGLAVPSLASTARGEVFLRRGPRQFVSLFAYVPGRELSPAAITPAHARQVGTFLGDMHQALRGFRRRRRNTFDPRGLAPKLAASRRFCRSSAAAPTAARDLEAIRAALLQSGALFAQRLPWGVVHGDLFTDNAKFVRGRLRAVFDFEMASSGPYVYDLGVAMCEWAFDRGVFAFARARALLQGYQSRRDLDSRERAALPLAVRYAAARFALSRFFDFEVSVRPGAERKVKDYREYVVRLRALERATWLAPLLRDLG